MFIHRMVTPSLVCAVLLFPGACRAQGDFPKAAAEAKKKYDAALTEAGKKLQEARESIEQEQAGRIAAAQKVYDAAAMNAKREYIAALKRVEQAERNADRESSRELVAAELKSLTEGGARTEIQKQWVKVNEAEQKNEYATAIEIMRKMVEDGDDSPSAYILLRLGRIYSKQEKYDLAIGAYRRAADVAPKSAMPLYGLTACYLAKDRTDDAIESAKDILLLNPIDYYANKTLADQYYVRKDYRRAENYYRTLCEAYPEDVEASNGLAWSYVGLNAHAAAKPIFVAVLAVSPDNALATAGYYACVEAEKQSDSSEKPSP